MNTISFMKRKLLTETSRVSSRTFGYYKNTTGLSFAEERIGPLAAIATTVFYLLALYLLILQITPENLFASIYSESLIKTTHQHLLLLVGFDTLIYRKYYDTPPILVGHQPPSLFFTNLLKFYGLQLHHISPNNLVSVAGYAALCEGYLGIRPRVYLFQLFFSVRANYEDDGSLRTCGTVCFLPRRSKEYPFIAPLDSAIGWRGSWFYMADKPALSQARGLPPFKNIAAESRDSWTAVNDESATPYVKLLARRIAKLSMDGLTGIDTINCWISRWIQPLQHRDSLMHEYTGANDGMCCSNQELDPKVVEKRIRSLMKSPRKKPLKFGMAMFENGSCPLVSSFSAIVPYDTFILHKK
jgi:hypothetical protein